MRITGLVMVPLLVFCATVPRAWGEIKVVAEPERGVKLPFKSVLEVAPVSALVLLSTEVVRKDLELTPQQRGEVQRLRKQCDDAFQGMIKAYESQPRKVRETILLDENMEAYVGKTIVPEIRKVLTSEQLERLEQLDRYRMGIALYKQLEYEKYLGLSSGQRAKVSELRLTCSELRGELNGTDVSEAMRTKLEEKATTHEVECLHQIFVLLRSEQKRRLTHLIGTRKVDLWTLNRQIREQKVDVNTLGWNIVFE